MCPDVPYFIILLCLALTILLIRERERGLPLDGFSHSSCQPVASEVILHIFK